ncbi:MAG: hypothetical protein ACOC0O_05080 [Spirochaetota bacterium]
MSRYSSVPLILLLILSLASCSQEVTTEMSDDEIKAILADLSNEQSRVISESLSGLKRSVEQSVAITDTTGTSFEAIHTYVEQASATQRSVREDMNTQAERSGRVVDVLSTINQITQEACNGSQEKMQSGKTVIAEISSLVNISHKTPPS